MKVPGMFIGMGISQETTQTLLVFLLYNKREHLFYLFKLYYVFILFKIII